MASLKSLFTTEKPLLSVPEPAISVQEVVKMDLSKILLYTPGPGKGKPATWSVGKVSIPHTKLNKVVSTVQKVGANQSPEGKSNLFDSLMEMEGKSGKAFIVAINDRGLEYLDVIAHVINNPPKKGKVAGSGGGKSGKVMAAFAKACAIKYPAATSKDDLFMSLLNFIENVDTQKAIFEAFGKMATKNGIKENGMIELRKMTPEARAKAVIHGKTLGNTPKPEKAAAKKK